MSQDPPRDDQVRLDRVVRDEFPDNPPAARLIAAFLHHRHAYRRDFVGALVALAISPTGGELEASPNQAWEIRRLASLILQQQFLRLPAGEVDESLRFLRLLGLMSAGRPTPRIVAGVLKDGYTTTEPAAFLNEFRRHLGRLGRVFAPLGHVRVSPRALLDFLAVSRQDCKLALGRYLFHPDEVAERVFAQVRRSSGEPIPFNYTLTDGEACRKLTLLPGYEAGLVRALREASETFWASEQTSSRLNSLVEQPLGTVVLTIKPPGSSLEIEIKRAGRRAQRPLTIVHERGGKPVPPPHRLDGGSSADMLQWEAGHAAYLSRIYRLVNHEESPTSFTTAITSPETLPLGDGRCEHLIDYFSDPVVFGDEFAGMRHALRQAVAAFARERGAVLSGLQGLWGETLEFLQYAVPAQAILVGSTSFRLDVLCRYLSAEGVRHYFEADQEGAARPGAARRFADSLLEEILGIYRPPQTTYTSHEHYLEAAFARPENRVRSDRIHASLTRQLGTFWATLLALRGYSFGESFVARNVGLRSIWEQGRWRVRIIFMDHDNLHLPTGEGDVFHPGSILLGTMRDESHVMGHIPKLSPLSGAVDYLRAIYRIDDETAEQHRLLLREAMARAYRKTQRKLGTGVHLKRIIPAAFVAGSQAWDQAIAIFLRRRGPDHAAGWSEEADSALEGQGLPADVRRRYLRAIEDFAPFLERHRYLFIDEPKTSGTGASPEAWRGW
jgi:hypothetical protein